MVMAQATEVTMDKDKQQRDDYTGWPVEVPAQPGTPETTGLGLDEGEGSGGSERLDALPGHEDDAARGALDEPGDPSGQPYPEEDRQQDQTGHAGLPPGGPIANT